jgi:hypothetical protein
MKARHQWRKRREKEINNVGGVGIGVAAEVMA